MKKSIILVAVIFLAGSLFLPAKGRAQTATSNDQQIQIIMQQLQSLLKQVKAMQQSNSQSVIQPTVPPSQVGYVTLEELPGNPQVSCVLPDLKQGSRGNSVYLLQMLLKNAGHYPEGLITGYFGPLTQKALNTFKSANPNGDLNSLVQKYFPECGSQIINPPVPVTTSTQPSITVLSPNGGETYKTSSTILSASLINSILQLLNQMTQTLRGMSSR